MSVVLTESELRSAISDHKLIIGGHPASVEGLKYDFALGTLMLFGGKGPIDASKLSEHDRAELVVRPGELVYVMSEEALELPDNVKAELSPKRKIGHLGIMVLGGFCVDPCYRGHLIFALYNLSARPFPLQPGRKLIAAQFYQLSPEETPPQSHPEPLYRFPDDLIQLMQGYRPATIEGLQAGLSDLARSLEDLRRDVQTKEEWFDRFQGNLDKVAHSVGELTHNVDKLREGLQDEITARKDVTKSIGELKTGVASNNALLLVGSALAIAIVGAFIGVVLTKLLGG